MKERDKSKFLLGAARLIGLCALASLSTLAAPTTQFKLLRGHLIVITVTVGGANPHEFLTGEFLLDTGSSTTLISPEFARRLRLRPVDRIELVTVAGARAVPRVWLNRLSVGSKSLENVEALVSDLSETRAAAPELCGVLGQNFLSRFNYLIDYRERRIVFEAGDELESSLCGERLPIEWREGRALVPARSGVNKIRRLVLDSGIASLLLFAADGRDLKLDWAPGEPRLLQARSDLGSRIVRQRRLRGFSVGGVGFYDLPVAVMELKAAGEGRVEDGLLPTSLFEQVYFNHRKNFVILGRSEER